MLIKRDVLDAIVRGDIDLQFRRWTRPTVKPGGTLRTAVGLLAIGRVETMAPEAVSLADARRAGFADLAAFNRWLGTMKDGPLFQRIELSFAGEDPQATLGRRRNWQRSGPRSANSTGPRPGPGRCCA